MTELSKAFDQAFQYPNQRILVLTRRSEDLSVQFLDNAHRYGASINRVEMTARFTNGSWVRKMSIRPSYKILGLRADLVLCDTRATAEQREVLFPLVSDPKRPGVIKPFSIALEATAFAEKMEASISESRDEIAAVNADWDVTSGDGL